MKARTILSQLSAVAGIIALCGSMAMAAPTPPGPGGIPDYFGTSPNFANSPLPKVTLTGATVVYGGWGYVSPQVDFLPPLPAGQTASATVDPATGAITGVTVPSGLTFFGPPSITITETDPDAASVAAGATIKPTVTYNAATPVGQGKGIRKFVDSLAGLDPGKPNTLGQFIPVAKPDTVTYPGSDYYEIELIQYSQKMHSDLPDTLLRGYRQANKGTNTNANSDLCGGSTPRPCTKNDNTVAPPSAAHYLGPVIVAQKDRPVRIKFTNNLPVGTAGNLFIPVDTSAMGAGTNGSGATYTQNRADLHLHGGLNPWISDGTPNQWITPANESALVPHQGVSMQNVPDMPAPGGGSSTYYYTNQQSSRLLFYHDHAYGLTRLNVYAGEAAGYLIRDDMEKQLIASGTIPADEIPLIIQDKSFVDANTIGKQDPTWNWGRTPGTPNTGDLWFPHVYMPNQNPTDVSGANAMGRWDHALWFWPPYTGLLNHGLVANPYYDPANAPWEPQMVPDLPNPSLVPEAFMDTPVVNGTAYPYVEVEPKAYRFRILNACNDRFLNLQLYQADTTVTTLDGRTNTEVKMVPAVKDPTIPFPAYWPTLDGRDGGVPDPRMAGPNMIQIGTESGFLPAPAVLKNTPVGYNYNRRDIVVLNVQEKTLFMGPAERADVIIDFSKYAGKTLILYNDSPAPVPASDPRVDYYTDSPDMTDTGGAPSTLAGFGPNTRTVMQIRVKGTTPAPAFDMAKLQAAFATTNGTPGVFAASQHPTLIPTDTYNTAYGKSFPADAYVRIQDNAMTFKTVDGMTLTMNLQPKAIQELFETNYGRMNATLGVELPFTNNGNQTTIPLGYIDPPTEILKDAGMAGPPTGDLTDSTQIWKVTHNGVDTHAIHFHLFDVQLINRVGWDGAIRPPDANELGWKETVRMNPLEDCIVALRPVAPELPFGLPKSKRLMDPASPEGSTGQFTGIDPLTNNPIVVTNELTDFGWEYVWHCHLLGHEENDMMRPIVFNVPVEAPGKALNLSTSVSGTGGTRSVKVSWTDPTPATDPATLGNPSNEIGFRLQRTTTPTNERSWKNVATALANATSAVDTTATAGTTYYYRVQTWNAFATPTNSTTITVKP